MEAISNTTKAVATPDTLINIIEGESVLLNLKNETYYGLDTVGTEMWNCLTTSASTQDAYDALLNEYEVTPEILREDLLNLIEKLLANQLIEIVETA